jgi:hypothetical protein
LAELGRGKKLFEEINRQIEAQDLLVMRNKAVSLAGDFGTWWEQMMSIPLCHSGSSH